MQSTRLGTVGDSVASFRSAMRSAPGTSVDTNVVTAASTAAVPLPRRSMSPATTSASHSSIPFGGHLAAASERRNSAADDDGSPLLAPALVPPVISSDPTSNEPHDRVRRASPSANDAETQRRAHIAVPVTAPSPNESEHTFIPACSAARRYSTTAALAVRSARLRPRSPRTCGVCMSASTCGRNTVEYTSVGDTAGDDGGTVDRNAFALRSIDGAVVGTSTAEGAEGADTAVRGGAYAPYPSSVSSSIPEMLSAPTLPNEALNLAPARIAAPRDRAST